MVYNQIIWASEEEEEVNNQVSCREIRSGNCSSSRRVGSKVS